MRKLSALFIALFAWPIAAFGQISNPTTVAPFLALGGCTIGSDALCTTGSATVAGQLHANSIVGLAFTSGRFDIAADTMLYRDAANTWGFRNDTNAQTLNIYRTYTDTSNYTKLLFGFSGSSVLIDTLGAGTGASVGPIYLRQAGTNIIGIGNGAVSAFWNITQNGHMTAGTDNTYDIGASGATRPRTLYLGTSLVSPKGVFDNITETATITAAAPSSTTNFDVITQGVQYYTTNAANNWTLNIRGNSGTSLNTMLSTGQAITIAMVTTQGATAYYESALTIDGSAVTPKWQGGTAPTAGNVSGLDIYTYTIIKTASATFTVLASQVQFK